MHHVVMRFWSVIDANVGGSNLPHGLTTVYACGVMKTGGTGAISVALNAGNLVVTGANSDEDGKVFCIGIP